jgi:hypothetical protein
VLTLYFPEGYKPNGNKIKELSKELSKYFNGSRIIHLDQWTIRVKIKNNAVAQSLFNSFVNKDYD